MTVSVDQVQTDLPFLLSRVKVGETIDIEQEGSLVGRLVPAPTGDRCLGILEGRGVVPDDIKTPFKDEIEEMFYGK